MGASQARIRQILPVVLPKVIPLPTAVQKNYDFCLDAILAFDDHLFLSDPEFLAIGWTSGVTAIRAWC